jgi:hypothetical protein
MSEPSKPKKLKAPPEWIRIPKYCSNKGCKHVGVVAKKLSDFWVVLCDDCQGKTITLDVDKILAEKPDGFTPGMAT